MKRIVCVLFCILATTTICAAQSALYFPQVAEGAQGGGFVWGTIIAITNAAAPGSPAASGTLTLTKDNGTPWSLPLTDLMGGPLGTASSFSFQLAGGQTKIFGTAGVVDGQKDSSPLATGFATVTSNLPLVGSLFFDERGPIGTACPGCQQSFGRIAEAGVPPATPLTGQIAVALASNAQQDNSNSAMAIANPGAATANITFQLLDTNGAAVAPPVTKTLAGNNHTAFFINQLFPNIAVIGTVRITSDIPLVATALLFENSGQFATFPVFPLP